MARTAAAVVVAVVAVVAVVVVVVVVGQAAAAAAPAARKAGHQTCPSWLPTRAAVQAGPGCLCGAAMARQEIQL